PQRVSVPPAAATSASRRAGSPLRKPRAAPAGANRRRPVCTPCLGTGRADHCPPLLHQSRDLALVTGPAFLWWQLALGAALAAGGATALLAARRSRLDGIAALWLAQAFSATRIVGGATIVVTSFGTPCIPPKG